MEHHRTIRVNFRLTPAGKEVLAQIATTLGLTMSNTVEVLVRKEGIALGILRPREVSEGPSTTGGD